MKSKSVARKKKEQAPEGRPKRSPEQEEHRRTRCKHFNGIQHDACDAGVRYDEVRRLGEQALPCLPTLGRGRQLGICHQFELSTPEELAAEDALSDESFTKLQKGISTCCDAPLDRSQLVDHGRFKGYGWIVCSKCRRGLIHVHG